MYAKQALEITKNKWAENEKKYLSYLVGFESKIETAAKEGRATCPICVIPSIASDFVSYYFEQMGYFVFVQPVSAADVLISLNWKTVPYMSVAHIESMEMDRLLEGLGKNN